MLTVNKNEAITKLNCLIEDGRQNAGQVIEHVMANQPQDYIVKAIDGARRELAITKQMNLVVANVVWAE